MAVLFTRRGAAPSLGKKLSDYAEGDKVKIAEGGTLAEFYVAKHNYNSDINTNSGTLLLRCGSTTNRQFGSGNRFYKTDLFTWFNGEYYASLPQGVQSAILMTKYLVTIPGSYYGTTEQTESKIFTPAATEYGSSTSSAVLNEGSALPSTVVNDTAGFAPWTRTQSAANGGYWIYLYPGKQFRSSLYNEAWGSRPCFVLSGNSLFDPDTNEFIKG